MKIFKASIAGLLCLCLAFNSVSPAAAALFEREKAPSRFSLNFRLWPIWPNGKVPTPIQSTMPAQDAIAGMPKPLAAPDLQRDRVAPSEMALAVPVLTKRFSLRSNLFSVLESFTALRNGSKPSSVTVAARAARTYDGSDTVAATEGNGVLVRDLPASRRPLSLAPPLPNGGQTSDRKALRAIYLTHAGHMISLSFLWRIAWPLLVLDKIHKSGLSLVVAFDAVAEISLGIAAGMIVDRLLPVRSMAAASFLRAGVGVVLASVVPSDSPSRFFFLGFSLVHVFAMTVLYLGQAAVSPAAARGEGALQRLNITLKLISTAVSIPAAYLGGKFIDQIGLPAAFTVYAILNAFVLAPMYMVLFPKTMAHQALSHAQPVGPRTSLRELAVFIMGNRVLVGLLAATMAAMTFAEPLRNTILPILAKELMHGGAPLLGRLLAAFYIGQIVGSLVLLKWPNKLSPTRWIQLAAVGLASVWLLALVPVHEAFLYIAVTCMSMFTQPAATVIKTMFQREVARRRPDLLGRAMGVHLTLYSLFVGGETAVIGWTFVALTASFLAPISALAYGYTALGLVLLLVVQTALKTGPPAATPQPSAPRKHLLGPAVIAASLGLIGAAIAWKLKDLSVFQLHILFGTMFGWIALWQAVTGSVSLLRPVILEKFDPKLPPQTLLPAMPEKFAVPPSEAAGFALVAAPMGVRIRTIVARTAPSPLSELQNWYEFEMTDGSLIAIDGRSGRVLPSLRDAAFIKNQISAWLHGSAWSVKGEPELLTDDGEYYRKGELPHYRVTLAGPGDYQAFFSARDGRLLAVHSRTGRILRWIGMGVHAWGIKALRKYDVLKRLVAPLLLGVPLLVIAGTAFWMRLHNGFSMEWPSLSWSMFQWHRFLGSYALFILMLAAVTGPASLMIPLINKYITPTLPPAPEVDPLTYQFSPPVRDSEWMKAEIERWLSDSPWSLKGEPVLQTEFDDLYRKGELPVYRVRLNGPGDFQVYLSARDGRMGPLLYGKFTRLERFLERRIYGIHALDFGPFSRWENARRVLLITFVTLPIILTVLAGLAMRFIR